MKIIQYMIQNKKKQTGKRKINNNEKYIQLLLKINILVKTENSKHSFVNDLVNTMGKMTSLDLQMSYDVKYNLPLIINLGKQ